MLKAIASFLSGTEPAGERAAEAATPCNAAALLEAPERALRDGQTDEAIRLIEALLRDHHDLAEAHLLLGILLHGRGQFEDARDSYTLAACFKPDWWPVHFQFGLLELDQRRPAAAIASLLKAVALGGHEARVYNALGAAYTDHNEVDKAVQQFRAALALQPDLADAHSNLGYVLFRDLEQFDEGTEHIEAALRLAPDDAAVLCNWNMVLQHRGRTDEALALCDALLTRDPGLDEPRVNRAMMLLSRGDFAAGWEGYETRKRLPRNEWPHDLPWREWDGSDLAGKTVFVHSEQGIGDEIMFASCLPEFIPRAGTCIVECHPKLEPIFRRSFPDAVIVRKDTSRRSDLKREPDWTIGIGSLPRFVRNKLEDFPRHRGYLRADAARVAYWRERLTALPGRTKVGISWRGGAPSTRRSLRSIALPLWAPLLSLDDVDFVSVQYSDCAEEIVQTQNELGVEIQHWPDAIDDYDETAALVAALDLVISVQTAVVHLAGALGQRAWALISAVPEWRYGAAGEVTPWYPSVKLIRQQTLGEWGPVMKVVGEQLRNDASSSLDA